MSWSSRSTKSKPTGIMEIRQPEDGVNKIISKDILTSEQIWNILCDLLPEKSRVFASFSTAAGMFVWTLPGTGWTPLSEADDSTALMVRDTLKAKRRAVARALSDYPSVQIEALFTVPSDDFVFFRDGLDGQFQIMLAAWDYRFPDPLEGMEVKMPDDAPEKWQDVTLKFIEADRPVPGYGLRLKLADGRFAAKRTDADGCFPMPGLEIGKRFTVLAADGSRDFSFTVEEGRSLIVYDLTGPVTVEVEVTHDGMAAKGLVVQVVYVGRDYEAVTGMDGMARLTVPYRRDAEVTARVEGKEETVTAAYPVTNIRIDLISEQASVIVEYFRGEEPVAGQQVLVRVKGLEDIILHTDSGGRACCRVPLAEKSYVVAHSGRFVDKKNLQRETHFRFEEPVPPPPPPPPEPAEPEVDVFGNPEGDSFDLKKDGSMKGYKVVILNLPNIDLAQPKAALERKGFSVSVFHLCSPSELTAVERILKDKKSQLWVISEAYLKLADTWFDLIYRLFDQGQGLYFWSDNDPYFADTNIILQRLFRSKMSGDYIGQKVLSLQTSERSPGIVRNHPIATGLRNLYEGITISHVHIKPGLKPVVYSSDGKVVTACYESDGKRVLVDGGFTRLYCDWNAAGTDRFVVNCACWLAGAD